MEVGNIYHTNKQDKWYYKKLEGNSFDCIPSKFNDFGNRQKIHDQDLSDEWWCGATIIVPKEML